ncbi:hypothetical protein AB0M25_23715 [Streptomyces griseomycini]|uniref:hypothetical protein n=1 Tax=Streptomyces griseomycini TaxID=66895 RepID=UPI0034361F49
MDLERAVEIDPEDISSRFERLMLDTVEGRLEAYAEQWSDVLASPLIPPTEANTTFVGLFRALLIEPETRVTEATQEFLAARPGSGNLTEMLRYLAELSAVRGGVADRARQCHELIVEHTLR